MGIFAPDAAEPFSFGHLDSLSYFLVMHDISGIIAPLEAAELFLNPFLFGVMRRLYELYRVRVDHADPSLRPTKIPHSQYWRIPGVFTSLRGLQREQKHLRFYCLLQQLLAMRINEPHLKSIDSDIAATELGFLSTPCFIPYDATPLTPRDIGLHLSYPGQCVRARVCPVIRLRAVSSPL
jgi:hypothetical protein